VAGDHGVMDRPRSVDHGFTGAAVARPIVTEERRERNRWSGAVVRLADYRFSAVTRPKTQRMGGIKMLAAFPNIQHAAPHTGLEHVAFRCQQQSFPRFARVCGSLPSCIRSGDIQPATPLLFSLSQDPRCQEAHKLPLARCSPTLRSSDLHPFPTITFRISPNDHDHDTTRSAYSSTRAENYFHPSFLLCSISRKRRGNWHHQQHNVPVCVRRRLF
jgi:hypothetical protein